MLRRLLFLSIFIAGSAGALAAPAKENPKTLSNLTYKRGQFAISASVGTPLRDKLTVAVTEEGKPLKGEKVYFSFTQKPSQVEGAGLSTDVAVTGEGGIASSTVTVGNRPGLYQVAAFSPGVKGSPVVFSINAHKPAWLVFLFLQLLGGAAIFLFGIFYMSDSIQKFGGRRFGEIVERCTSNRFKALLVGTGLTALIQSSSATTVMVVSLINSGLMQFAQSIGIILGANIGTTITAQIVAFKLTDYALVFILIGFVIKFTSSVKRKKLVGDIILGFGLLFFGMKIMSDVTEPLRTYQPFIDLLLNLENPVVGVIAGGVFTAIIRFFGVVVGVCVVFLF